MENIMLSAENLKGKRVLLTGGTTGIGRAIAIALASCGAKLLILGRDEAKIAETLEEIKTSGTDEEVHSIQADTAKEQDIKRIFQLVDEKLGGLDVLINNAAIAYGSITEGQYKDWEYLIKTNLLGYLACANEAVTRMEKQGDGCIINIGSMSADVREQGSSVYVATKAGIQGFSSALRKEVNEKGITVSLIEPGAVFTEMQPGTDEELQEKVDRMEMMVAEDIARSVIYVLTQPKRVSVVDIKIRPLKQLI